MKTHHNQTRFMDDDPRNARLPREVAHSASVRSILGTLFVASLVVISVNAYALTYLEARPMNTGYLLINEKWRLLESLEQPVDVLVIGDSSCNQSIDPEAWESTTGMRALNLCTFGNMTAADGVWMAQAYIAKHGPPEQILVMHVYDVWHRDLDPTLLGIIPEQWRHVWRHYEPLVNLDPLSQPSVFLARYVPIYSRNLSLKEAFKQWLARRGETPKTATLELTDRGYMRHDKAHPSSVEGDVREHIRFVTGRQFEMSEINRRALQALSVIGRQHRVPITVVHSPIAKQLETDPTFRQYAARVEAQLGAWADGGDALYFEPGFITYSPEEMQNADHLVHMAAQQHTIWMAKKLNRRDR